MKPRTIAALILASVCFCIGLYSVVMGERTTASPSPSLISLFQGDGISSWFSGNKDERTTILVVGVDRFDRPDPVLQAVWIITLHPTEKEVLFSGVPTNLALDDAGIVRLNSFFAWSPESGVTPPFIEALERALRLQVDTIAVLDERGFGTLVDYLGGLPFEGGVLSGDQVLALHTVFRDDPVGLVRLQASVLENLEPQIRKLGAAPDLETLLALIPEHAQLSEHTAQFVLSVSHLLPLEEEQVGVEVILSSVP